MSINIPLLRKALEHITEHPEEHNQAVWAQKTPCGTACCLAGWAVQFAGHEIDWEEAVDYHVRLSDGSIGLHYSAGDLVGGAAIEEVAQDELGLTADEAYVLFQAGNTLDDLWRLAHRFTDGEIDIPEQCQ